MISQRRREPLERFLRAFAVGKIMETSKDGRPLYHYYPQNAADTRYVAELLLTRVSEVKREQISAALERYDAERSEPRKKPGRKPGSPGRKWTEVEKRHLSEVQANIRRKVA